MCAFVRAFASAGSWFCRGRWIRAFSADLEDHGLMRVQRLVYGYIWKVVVIDKLTPIFGL